MRKISIFLLAILISVLLQAQQSLTSDQQAVQQTVIKMFEALSNRDSVSFELIVQENKRTLVKLMHQGIETFPKDNPDLAKANFEKGWNSIINTTLKEYLELPE